MKTLTNYAEVIFALGLGLFMLEARQLDTGAHWTIGILIVLASILTIVQFGSIAVGWKIAYKYVEEFGPDGKSHERALNLFDWSSRVVNSYMDKTKFRLSLGADIILMSGLAAQGWVVLFTLQFVACVLGYSVIRSFLSNYHDIYAFVNGSKA